MIIAADFRGDKIGTIATDPCHCQYFINNPRPLRLVPKLVVFDE